MLVPLVGNIAEHIVAVQVAYQNKMELSLGIAIGSGLQIALFVTPVLVWISVLLGNPMTLVFNSYELAGLIGALSSRCSSQLMVNRTGSKRAAARLVPDARDLVLLRQLRGARDRSRQHARDVARIGCAQGGSLRPLFGPP